MASDFLVGLEGFGKGFLDAYEKKRAKDDEEKAYLRKKALLDEQRMEEREWRQQQMGLKLQEMDAAAERELAEQDYRNQQLELLRGKGTPFGKVPLKLGGQATEIPLTNENIGDILRYFGGEREAGLRQKEIDLRSSGKWDTGGGREPTPLEIKASILKDLAGTANMITDPQARQEHWDFYMGQARSLMPDVFGPAPVVESPEALAIQGATTREDAQMMLNDIKKKNPRIFAELNVEVIKDLLSQLPSTGKKPPNPRLGPLMGKTPGME